MSKTITLMRVASNQEVTIGAIYYNDTLICNCFELPWRENMVGVSCIPPGVYQLRKRWSPKFQRPLYEVQDVPGRTHILIHAANYTSQLRGCIAPFTEVVTTAGKFFATGSGKAVKVLETLIKDEAIVAIDLRFSDTLQHS